jgi:hypothetical protein
MIDYTKYLYTTPAVGGEYYTLSLPLNVVPPIVGQTLHLGGVKTPVVVSDVNTPDDIRAGRGGPVALSMEKAGIAYRVNCLPEGHEYLEGRFVAAKLNGEYKNCSTQVNLPQDMAKAVMAWGQRKIEPENLYDDGENACGFEDDIHCTLLYGLTDDDPKAVAKLLSRFGRFDVRLGLVTAFLDNPKYDVVKIDVEAPELMLMHYILKGNLPNSNKFPTYSPHITAAYVKKGSAMGVMGDASFRGMTFDVSQILFCGRNGSRSPIHLLS